MVVCVCNEFYLLPIGLHMALLGVCISESYLAGIASVLVRRRGRILLRLDSSAGGPTACDSRHFSSRDPWCCEEVVQHYSVSDKAWIVDFILCQRAQL